jgi:hypothetical protein
MKVAIWIVGGVSLGLAMLFLIGAFGDTGFGLIVDGVVQPAALSYKRFGYDASMDVGITSNGLTGLFLLAFGLVCMISQNVGAWRNTNGY